MTKILLTYALAALSSLAAQITFGPTPFNLQITGSTGTIVAPSTVSTLLEFPQFDPSLGTLTGVEFTLSNSGQSESVSLTATRGSRGSLLAWTTSAVTGSAVVPGVVLPTFFFLDGIVDVACGGVTTQCSATRTDSGAVSGGISVAPGQFGLYTGTGTVSTQLIYTAGRTIPIGLPLTATLTATVTGTWTGEWNLTYTYDEAAVAAEVPEPGTWAQGVVGLVGVAWLMRRRRSMR